MVGVPDSDTGATWSAPKTVHMTPPSIDEIHGLCTFGFAIHRMHIVIGKRSAFAPPPREGADEEEAAAPVAGVCA